MNSLTHNALYRGVMLSARRPGGWRCLLRCLLMISCLWLPLQAPQAALVNQNLDIALSIGFIGSSVPALYSRNLSIGDLISGSITASNVNDALEGNQSSGISLGNHQLTIVGQSYDLAGSPYASDVVRVSGGVVDAINYATGSINVSSTLPYIAYQIGSNYWRIIFPGFNLSDPLSDQYTISGNYSAQLASVPIPAAVWLFGAGLSCLLGVAMRKKAS